MPSIDAGAKADEQRGNTHMTSLRERFMPDMKEAMKAGADYNSLRLGR